MVTTSHKEYSVFRLYTGDVGAPRYGISTEQLNFFIENGFNGSQKPNMVLTWNFAQW